MITSEHNWQQQMRQALRSKDDLESFFEIPFPKVDYPIFVPLNLATRIKEFGIDSPLGRQFLPSACENAPIGMNDPIGDHAHSPSKQLVHRYKNRLLFFPTSTCPVQCRYCFRKNELHDNDELFKADFIGVKNYLKQHPEVQEIIFSGGDPLMLSNEKIEYYLNEFAALKIPMVRFHSRMPIITPARLDEGLYQGLLKASQQFSLVSVAIHLNHADEITSEFETLMQKFRSLPIQWLSQTVLLKDVNDNILAQKDLYIELLKLGIKPYYLHHPDQVRGGMHFWLSIEEGRRLYAALREELPGHAIPQYVVDIPGGHGKVPLYNPEQFEFNGTFLSKNGQEIAYFLN